MKLLGVRLDDHDASFCLYDNGKVSYLKTERIYQVKHHAYNNTNQWTVDLKRAFNLEPGDLVQVWSIVPEFNIVNEHVSEKILNQKNTAYWKTQNAQSIKLNIILHMH